MLLGGIITNSVGPHILHKGRIFVLIHFGGSTQNWRIKIKKTPGLWMISLSELHYTIWNYDIVDIPNEVTNQWMSLAGILEKLAGSVLWEIFRLDFNNYNLLFWSWAITVFKFKNVLWSLRRVIIQTYLANGFKKILIYGIIPKVQIVTYVQLCT